MIDENLEIDEKNICGRVKHNEGNYFWYGNLIQTNDKVLKAGAFVYLSKSKEIILGHDHEQCVPYHFQSGSCIIQIIGFFLIHCCIKLLSELI